MRLIAVCALCALGFAAPSFAQEEGDEAAPPAPQVVLAANVYKLDCFENVQNPNACRVAVEITVTPVIPQPLSTALTCTAEMAFIDDYGRAVVTMKVSKHTIAQVSGETHVLMSIEAAPATAREDYSGAKINAVICRAE